MRSDIAKLTLRTIFTTNHDGSLDAGDQDQNSPRYSMKLLKIQIIGDNGA